jgi:diaminopimelate epimerase
MRVHLTSGAGNDFLALIEPDADPPAERVRAWCRRGLSLGADGLFVLRRRGGGGGTAAVEMTHYNADGTRAELCVNGTRCAARLAFALGWATGEVEVGTGAGPIAARDAGAGRVALALAAPGAVEEFEVVVGNGPGAETVGGTTVVRGWRVAVGVPHFVVPWRRSLAEAPLAGLGPPLRGHPAFGEAGTNVDWVRWLGGGRIEVRSWERGVEAETLACGSGVLAAAAAGLAAGEVELPVVALTAGGAELEVADAGGGRWELTGEARLLGVVEVNEAAAAAGPAGPARWTA